MAQSKKGKKPASRTAKSAQTAKVTKAAKTSKAAKPAKAGPAVAVTKPAASAEADSKKSRAATRMESWNKWLAAAYAVEALAIIIAGTGHTFPVVIHFLGVDTMLSQTAGHTVNALATRHLFDVPLAQVLALVLAIPAVLHLMLSSYLHNQYNAWMERGMNPIRWLDGAFSASLLPVAIGLAAGFSDITGLLMLFALGFITHLLGMLMELYNQPYTTYKADTPAKDTKPFFLMVVAGTAAWLALGLFLGASLIFGAGLPWHAWVSYLTALVFVVLITLLLVRNYRRQGRWKDYQKTERAFMVLSFAAKSVVAWELFAAVLRP